jgi:hypothetical protein
VVRVYCSKNCPALHILLQENCEVVIMEESSGVDRSQADWQKHPSHKNMFWRYYILDELVEGDVVLFRDADSHLSEREVEPVKKWLNSNKIFMRFVENESYLNSTFMGGCWGAKGGVLKGMKESTDEWIELYSTFDHSNMFIDLCYHNYVLGNQIKESLISFGYKQEFTLPDLKENEHIIGYVENSHWRNEVFNPDKYELNRLVKHV